MEAPPTPITAWFETNPGDNMPPQVKNVGYLAYDDQLPLRRLRVRRSRARRAIRAPLGDRDNVPSSTDYGGVILDTRNDGRTAICSSPTRAASSTTRVTDDALGRGLLARLLLGRRRRRSPPTGWTLEIRIPFSSLRYAEGRSRRPGASCSTATIRATSATRSSRTRLPRGTQLLHLQLERARRASRGLPGGGAPGGRAVRRRAQPERDAERRPRARRSTSGRARRRRRPRRQVDARAPTPRSTPRSTRTSRRSSPTSRRSRPTSASRSSTRRSGRSSSRASSSSRRRSRRSTRARSPRRAWACAAPASSGRTDVHGARRPGPRRRQRDPARARTAPSFADQDFRSLVGDRPRPARPRQQLREPARARTASVEGGGSTGSLGPDFQWRPNDKDTVTGQFLLSWTADAGSARPGRASGTAASSPATPATSGGRAARETLRLVRRVPRLRRRLPRRQRLRAAGRLSARPSSRPATRSGPKTGFLRRVRTYFIDRTRPTATATC